MSNEVALVKAAEYAVATMDAAEFSELIEASLGPGGGIRSFDLDRFKIPAGGGMSWQPESSDAEERKEITGVIVGLKDVRAYWRQSLKKSGGKSPPDCSSQDTVQGFGVRFDGDTQSLHDCTTCPMAQFGSDVDEDGNPGKGQACAQRKLVYILEPQAVLPTVINLPPTSLKPMKNYLLNRLVKQRKRPWDVETIFKLRKERSAANGIDYAAVDPYVSRVLDDEAKKAISERARVLRAYLEKVQARVDDFRETNGAHGEA